MKTQRPRAAQSHAAFFFGRDSADDPYSPIGQLVRKVREHSFVMVMGQRHIGKSSRVQAGLLPALRRERDRLWMSFDSRDRGDAEKWTPPLIAAPFYKRYWSARLHRGCRANLLPS